ncbi:hypothetical protein C3K47_15360 [Solitalea longa]|uniref:Right handed beta helix domain-containing protein n=1 Tax=Solitalea longa TaxID=2079460 RepID=A0A2S4ZYS3_9SPHI|nr:right-handed parallel beta-helix repeat-containing protein [Solitalea longa]POY35436.1 hypothetical protein C3K47_15360 [Solitalea longa]
MTNTTIHAIRATKTIIKSALFLGTITLITASCDKTEEVIEPQKAIAVEALASKGTETLMSLSATVKAVPTSYNYTVSNAAGFVAALAKVKAGEAIFLSANGVFDFTNYATIKIPANVTIYSSRNRIYSGTSRSAGAKIITNNKNIHPLFKIMGPNVRISGIRILGPDTAANIALMKQLIPAGTQWKYAYSRAIESSYDYLEVDNCEIAGWSHAGIYLTGGKNAAIHDNNFHHIQRYGTGYGVCLNGGTALVTRNTFDWMRHAIAGTGIVGEEYESSYNTLGNHFIAEPFDMHGGKDRKDGTNIAGSYVYIHHNTSYFTGFRTVLINGVPVNGVKVTNNSFIQKTEFEAIRLDAATTNKTVTGNVYSIPVKSLVVALISY